MATRASGEQHVHDTVVQKLAGRLEEGVSEVRADGVGGFPDPPTIAGRVPDVTIGSLPDTVVEVETDTNDDSRQREAFKRWAEEESPRTYRGVYASSPSEWVTFEIRG